MSIISLSYPHELKESLQESAKKDGRSLSNYICNVLYKHQDALDQEPELKKRGPKTKKKTTKKKTKRTKK